jgi:WD40 repeat protein
MTPEAGTTGSRRILAGRGRPGVAPGRLRRRMLGRRGTGTQAGYDGFISYSHEGDLDLAAILQAGVEKFAKRWYEARALRLFRDKTSLALTPQLWPEIEQALAKSDWFVLMASPKAAASRWVNQEIGWWLEHRDASRVLIVLTSGKLTWDTERADFDWDHSDAVPRSLAGAFAGEPLWVAARPDPEDAIAMVASAIRGIDKDKLVGVAVREHRRTMRLAAGAISGLAVLLVLAVAAASIAAVQRSRAVEQANISLSRQVAATSQSLASTNLRVALLLAVQAYQLNHNAQTLAALMQADTSVPALVRYLPAGGEVTHLTGSAGGKTIVAGLADGRVMYWNLPDPAPRVAFRLPAAVSDLAVSSSGTEIAASDGTSAELWRSGHARRLAVPAGEKANAVALSPSGRTLLVHGASAAFGQGSIEVLDAGTGKTRAVHPDPFPGSSHGQVGSFTLPSDTEVMLLDTADGFWQWRKTASWRLLAKNTPRLAPLGVTQPGAVPSGNGRYITNSDGTRDITVRPTLTGGTGTLDAQTPVTSTTARALSYDGTKLAAAASGVIYVAAVARPGASRAAVIPLAGNGNINEDSLSFLGAGGSRLISATGGEIALWNVGQLDRLARSVPTPVIASCSACRGPEVAVSPDGTRAAITVSEGSSATIQPLPGATGRPQVVGGLLEPYLEGFPLWLAGGRHLILPFSDAGPRPAGPSKLPSFAYSWQASRGDTEADADTLASDGRSVIVVDNHSGIYVQNARDGTVKTTMHGPPLFTHSLGSLQPAAIDPGSNLVAMAGPDSVKIVNPFLRRVIGTIGEKNVTAVAFAARLLLLQRSDGTLEVWNDQGTSRELTIPGDASYAWPPVPNEQGTLVARQRSDGSIVLDDLSTGNVLDTFSGNSELGTRKTGVAFSPDGMSLVAVTEAAGLGNGTLTERAIAGAALARAACDAAGSSLSAAEWRTFISTQPPKALACGG